MESASREAALEVLLDICQNASDDQHRIRAFHALLAADETYAVVLADQIAERVVARLEAGAASPPPIE
jgi:hypothetical protein